jgi:hypothetical protein
VRQRYPHSTASAVKTMARANAEKTALDALTRDAVS